MVIRTQMIRLKSKTKYINKIQAWKNAGRPGDDDQSTHLPYCDGVPEDTSCYDRQDIDDVTGLLHVTMEHKRLIIVIVKM